jgi:hypothetical protein
VKRRRKHPKAPKHPLSAYLFFVATHRAQLTARYSDRSFSEVARILGSVWKRVPGHEKRKYEILAESDKRRYKYEMNDWNESPAKNGSAGEEPASTDDLCLNCRADGGRKQSTSSQSPDARGTRDAAQAITDLSRSAPRKHPASDAKTSKKRKASTSSSAVEPCRRSLLRYHHDASRAVAGSIVEQSADASTLLSSPPIPSLIALRDSDSRRASALLSSRAFTIFTSSERDAVLQVHPNVDAGELETALQTMWNELSEHEKTV